MESNTVNYKELNNGIKKINKWNGKKTKVLSIRTRPFNSNELFLDIIIDIVNDNGKVLYVFCSNDERYIKENGAKLYNKIEKKIGGLLQPKNIKIISIDFINEIDSGYDLVIFDDITLFSKMSSDFIRDAVEDIYWRSDKIIIYSSEYIFPIGEKIDLMYLLEPVPMIEPRLMNTRIRLEENIPMALFEYFKWFKENKQIVLIVVPNEDKLNKVYNHYYEVLRELDIRVVRFNRNQDSIFIKNIMDGYTESLFIITNHCGHYINSINNLNIIILFTDDVYYSYKKIVYLCAAVKNNEGVPKEVIMVSKEITEDMDKARGMARKFNRSLWEKQYIRL